MAQKRNGGPLLNTRVLRSTQSQLNIQSQLNTQLPEGSDTGETDDDEAFGTPPPPRRASLRQASRRQASPPYTQHVPLFITSSPCSSPVGGAAIAAGDRFCLPRLIQNKAIALLSAVMPGLDPGIHQSS